MPGGVQLEYGNDSDGRGYLARINVPLAGAAGRVTYERRIPVDVLRALRTYGNGAVLHGSWPDAGEVIEGTSDGGQQFAQQAASVLSSALPMLGTLLGAVLGGPAGAALGGAAGQAGGMAVKQAASGGQGVDAKQVIANVTTKLAQSLGMGDASSLFAMLPAISGVEIGLVPSLRLPSGGLRGSAPVTRMSAPGVQRTRLNPGAMPPSPGPGWTVQPLGTTPRGGDPTMWFASDAIGNWLVYGLAGWGGYGGFDYMGPSVPAPGLGPAPGGGGAVAAMTAPGAPGYGGPGYPPGYTPPPAGTHGAVYAQTGAPGATYSPPRAATGQATQVYQTPAAAAAAAAQGGGYGAPQGYAPQGYGGYGYGGGPPGGGYGGGYGGGVPLGVPGVVPGYPGAYSQLYDAQSGQLLFDPSQAQGYGGYGPQPGMIVGTSQGGLPLVLQPDGSAVDANGYGYDPAGNPVTPYDALAGSFDQLIAQQGGMGDDQSIDGVLGNAGYVLDASDWFQLLGAASLLASVVRSGDVDPEACAVIWRALRRVEAIVRACCGDAYAEHSVKQLDQWVDSGPGGESGYPKSGSDSDLVDAWKQERAARAVVDVVAGLEIGSHGRRSRFARRQRR